MKHLSQDKGNKVPTMVKQFSPQAMFCRYCHRHFCWSKYIQAALQTWYAEYTVDQA